MLSCGCQVKVLKPGRVSSCKPSLDKSSSGVWKELESFLGAMCKTKTEIISFWPPVTCGYVKGGMGSMTRSSIHWRQDPASQSTKCSEEISPGRTMASSGKNGQTFGLHLKRLTWSAFYYFMRVNMFFQGTCFFLYWMFRVTYPCWWVHTVGWAAEDPEEKKGRGVSKQIL